VEDSNFIGLILIEAAPSFNGLMLNKISLGKNNIRITPDNPAYRCAYDRKVKLTITAMNCSLYKIILLSEAKMAW